MLKSMRLHPKLPGGRFVLAPQTPHSRGQSKSSVWTVSVGSSTKAKVRLTQFALVQAHAVTCHKAQGQTLKRIAIQGMFGLTKTGKETCLVHDEQWFYTAISRTTGGSGLRIIGKIPWEKIKQDPNVEEEMKRLQKLHEATERRTYGNADAPVDSTIKAAG